MSPSEADGGYWIVRETYGDGEVQYAIETEPEDYSYLVRYLSWKAACLRLALLLSGGGGPGAT